MLVTPTSEPMYTVSLVAFDGTVSSKVQASSPAPITCGNSRAAVLPLPVSTSNSSVYFMDAQGVVRFMHPNGNTGRATTVPVGRQRASTFAVSPDDQLIAVAVTDFSLTGAATSLYVEDLNGGAHHKVIYTESGIRGLWPIGWHGTNLVLATVPACIAGVPGPCCLYYEFHVVDPTDGKLKVTFGTGCILRGQPSPAGVICQTSDLAKVMDWTGTTTRSFEVPGVSPAYLSPNGNQAAMVTNVADTTVEGSHTTFFRLQVCGWIDSTRLLGTDPQGLAQVADFVTGAFVQVAAQGSCGGRIPGGL